MSNDPTLVMLGIFICWQGSALLSVIFKDRTAQIPKWAYCMFLFLGAGLALFRSAAYWYLSYRNYTHTATENLYPLIWCLLPEARFVMMLRSEAAFPMYVALIAGSFLWAFPLVIWSVPRKRAL